MHTYFPILAIGACTVAYVWPTVFVDLRGYIIYLLGAVMFCMGCSLQLADFKRAFLRIRLILLGLILQFSVMPFLAWQLSTIADLSIAFTTGMLLVGCAPGGTASNVMCYLSKGDVALSVVLTTVSTVLAVVATPLLTYLYLHQMVEVPIAKMASTIFYIIILPIALGLLVNQYFSLFSRAIHRYGADISVGIICLIIAIIVAINRDQLQSLSWIIFSVVFAHCTIGLSLGYLCTYLLTRDHVLSRTLAIEVGMQNSGLSVALAVKFYAGISALPGAMFSILQNIIGSMLASYWSRKTN